MLHYILVGSSAIFPNPRVMRPANEQLTGFMGFRGQTRHNAPCNRLHAGNVLTLDDRPVRSLDAVRVNARAHQRMSAGGRVRVHLHERYVVQMRRGCIVTVCQQRGLIQPGQIWAFNNRKRKKEKTGTEKPRQ